MHAGDSPPGGRSLCFLFPTKRYFSAGFFHHRWSSFWSKSMGRPQSIMHPQQQQQCSIGARRLVCRIGGDPESTQLDGLDLDQEQRVTHELGNNI